MLLLFAVVAFFEFFVKWLLVRSLSPLKFTPAEIARWPEPIQSDFIRCTQQLEKLGFIHLSDHTIPSSGESKPISRLFAHRTEKCFAEVSQTRNAPTFCSFISHLENGWSLGTTNMKASVSLSATWYAFLRLPNRLGKSIENEHIDSLFRRFIVWRNQIAEGTGLDIRSSLQASDYFKMEQAVRLQQKQALLKKSILWALLEMTLYLWKPKSEWLGTYKKRSLT